MEIKYIEADTGRECVEKVYGEGAVKWLYGSLTGEMANSLVTTKWASKIYGLMQSSPFSQKKVLPFIDKFQINMDEFEVEEGRNAMSPYSSFNNFFIRKFKPGKRVFAEGNIFPAPCEARYFAWDKIDENVSLPVKGKFLSARSLLGNDKWAEAFYEGPGFIARLCPVDYHRFHFPDDGVVLDHYPVHGKLDSVNPIALHKKGRILIDNERYVSILETKHFGKLAYIEVGATCVGKIVQTTRLKEFSRGEEKGYFLFGGSTVIVLGEKGKIPFHSSVLINTQKRVETYFKLGMQL
jgi:phosphatidylserine decarboxylase